MIAINIEMPKACEECPIPYITDDMELKCPFQKLYVTGLDERAEGCPLEELNGAIEELNKIKAEIIGKCNHCYCVSCIFYSLEGEECLVKNIINKRIAELKGVNNGTHNDNT